MSTFLLPKILCDELQKNSKYGLVGAKFGWGNGRLIGLDGRNYVYGRRKVGCVRDSALKAN